MRTFKLALRRLARTRKVSVAAVLLIAIASAATTLSAAGSSQQPF